MTERNYGKILPEVSVADMQKFNTDFYNGSIVISFSTPGENYEWKPGPTIGVKFYAVKWDDADPAKNPAFNETMDEMEGNSLTYRWAVSTDAQGNLIVVAAVKNPLQLTDKQFFGWLLHPIELVLKEEQIPAHVRGWGLPTYPSELVSYVNKVQPAEFIILPNH